MKDTDISDTICSHTITATLTIVLFYFNIMSGRYSKIIINSYLHSYSLNVRVITRTSEWIRWQLTVYRMGVYHMAHANHFSTIFQEIARSRCRVLVSQAGRTFQLQPLAEFDPDWTHSSTSCPAKANYKPRDTLLQQLFMELNSKYLCSCPSTKLKQSIQRRVGQPPHQRMAMRAKRWVSEKPAINRRRSKTSSYGK